MKAYGHLAYPGTEPFGGGAGYSNIILPDNPNIYAWPSSVSGLLSAFSGCPTGRIIYILDGMDIDLAGNYDKGPASANVTIGGKRGKDGSAGGIIRHSTSTGMWLNALKAKANGLKLNGIRLIGPDGNAGYSDQPPLIWGLRCSGYTGFEVENCEITQWTFAGLAVYGDGLTDPYGAGAFHIHHNNIHHNQRLGEGYGIDHYSACGIIECNIFDYGRHFIAGPRGGVGYLDARYNIFGANCTHTCFDQHGGTDVSDCNISAGGTVLNHHNTFKSTSQPSMKPRGIPVTLIDVYNNHTYQPNQLAAFPQEFHNSDGSIQGQTYQGTLISESLYPDKSVRYIHMVARDNWYGTSVPPDIGGGPNIVLSNAQVSPSSIYLGQTAQFWVVATNIGDAAGSANVTPSIT